MPAAEIPEIITSARPISAGPPPSQIHPPPPAAESFAPHSIANRATETDAPRFAILQIVARFYEVLAVLALVGAVVSLLLLFAAVLMNPAGEILRTVMAIGLSIVWAVMAAMMFLFMAQTIRLGLQVERNTRETRRACERLAEHLGGIEHEA